MQKKNMHLTSSILEPVFWVWLWFAAVAQFKYPDIFSVGTILFSLIIGSPFIYFFAKEKMKYYRVLPSLPDFSKHERQHLRLTVVKNVGLAVIFTVVANIILTFILPSAAGYMSRGWLFLITALIVIRLLSFRTIIAYLTERKDNSAA